MKTFTKISENARIALTATGFFALVMLVNCSAWF